MKKTTKLKQHRITVAEMSERNEWHLSPLPLELIPNYMGINLSSVEAVRWSEQSDGQIVEFTIEFIPAHEVTPPEKLYLLPRRRGKR